MFGKLGASNAFLTQYFQLMMSLSGRNPIASPGRSIKLNHFHYMKFRKYGKQYIKN